MSDLMFPKPKWKKKKKRHPPSILPSDKHICYLCALEGDYRPKITEEHHVFYGGGLRKVSEENGFKVYLCRDHHKDGPRAAHNCRETRELLCRIFQRKYEETHTREEFRALGIKNYLEDEDGDGVVNPAIVKIKVEGDGNEVN